MRKGGFVFPGLLASVGEAEEHSRIGQKDSISKMPKVL